MSAILKAQASHIVRAYDPTPRGSDTPADSGDARTCQLPDPVTRLKQEKESLETALREAQASMEHAVARANEEGRREGLSMAARDEQGRLELLEAGISAGLAGLEGRLEALEGLAALVSRLALARIFDEPVQHAELVGSALARQMQHVRGDTILAVRVSSADFPDEESLSTLRDRAGAGAVRLLACPDLAQGTCIMDLRMGHVEVSPQIQWSRLSALLLELADAGADA